MSEIIKMEKINKSYRMGEESLHVLKDISFVVEKGDYLTILGPSGSGKTTLMNILGCMDTIDSGTYQFEDIDLDKCTSNDLSLIRNRKIGFIFQKYNLIPQYTALQNIIMPLLIRGMTKNEAVKKADETISLVGLSDRVLHKPNELSGGQQQRVAIARALVTEPSLLLADEPTGSLDSATGKDILALFQKLNDNGNTIIVISHDSKVAAQSKRVISIFDGKIAV
jgi:putative ABC transport system ATP-binding protein